jgi:hypothetical protein
MTKRIFSFFVLLNISFITLESCKQQEKDDPLSTVKAFSEALRNKDFNKARQLSTPGSLSTINMIEKGMQVDTSNSIWLPVLTEDFVYKEVAESNDEATIKMISKSTYEDFDVELLKQEKEWKVNFEINSLFRIMLRKLNKKGAAKARDLDFKLNELQQIDINSVENELDQSKLRLDSVKKHFRKQKK